MSTPALKPLPSAARITTRTSGSSPSPRTTSATSNQPATGSAFTGGLLITTSAMPPSTATVRYFVSFLMGSQITLPPVAPELDLTGRVAIVTGGARGIGRGIAERFLAAGADVVICARHEPDDPPAAVGRTASFVAADVRQADDVDRLVSTTVERHGRLDVLVNNAGGSPPADAATASPRFSAAIIDLNLIAPLNVAQR